MILFVTFWTTKCHIHTARQAVVG